MGISVANGYRNRRDLLEWESSKSLRSSRIGIVENGIVVNGIVVNGFGERDRREWERRWDCCEWRREWVLPWDRHECEASPVRAEVSPASESSQSEAS
nr:hypothetical protein CFP56_53161 [Quercus suber]